MKVYLKIARKIMQDICTFKMAIFLQVNFKMIKQTVLVFIKKKILIFQVFGKMIFIMKILLINFY